MKSLVVVALSLGALLVAATAQAGGAPPPPQQKPTAPRPGLPPAKGTTGPVLAPTSGPPGYVTNNNSNPASGNLYSTSGANGKK